MLFSIITQLYSINIVQRLKVGGCIVILFINSFNHEILLIQKDTTILVLKKSFSGFVFVPLSSDITKSLTCFEIDQYVTIIIFTNCYRVHIHHFNY